jgi:large subunit ribosomal protein L32e
MSKQEIIDTLTALKGIGTAKAEAIYAAGFTTIEKITSASVEDLTVIDGISETIATSIQQQLKTSSKAPSAKTAEKQPEAPSKKETTAPKTSEETPKKPSRRERSTKEAKPEDETGEEVEQPYEVKKKAQLDDALKQKLQIRAQVKKRTPTFLREEWFRYKRIAKNWRRPDGLHSKMRTNLKYRPSRVRVGFRGPKEARGLHPSGFEEVMVYNVKDLESINAETQAARIGSTVGSKKRVAIMEKAKERDIRLLNK